MSEFRLESRKASQSVRAFVEKMAGVGSDRFPIDVISSHQERIDLFYKVVVFEGTVFGFSLAFYSPPIEQVSEEIDYRCLSLDQ